MESKNKLISEHPKDSYNTKSVQDNPGKEIFDKIYREEHPNNFNLGNLMSAFITIAIGTSVLSAMNDSLKKGGVIK
jgi:hypothetical protein